MYLQAYQLDISDVGDHLYESPDFYHNNKNWTQARRPQLIQNDQALRSFEIASTGGTFERSSLSLAFAMNKKGWQ